MFKEFLKKNRKIISETKNLRETVPFGRCKTISTFRGSRLRVGNTDSKIVAKDRWSSRATFAKIQERSYPDVLKFLLKPVPTVFLSIGSLSLIVTKTLLYKRRGNREEAKQKGEGKIAMASTCQLRLARRAATKWKWDFAFYPWPVTSAPCSRTSLFYREDVSTRCPLMNQRHTYDVSKKKKPPISISLRWQCYSDSWANSLEIASLRKSARCEQVRKVKMSRRKKNDNRFVDVIFTFLILGCSFFSTNCQQGTFLFFWKYTREKYPFRTANSSASYFAFRPRGRVTDVIRAILSWIKHRVNANVLADICVAEDLWDSRLSRLNFYYPTTGRPQILRNIIIYCGRVIYEQRWTWKFVQPRPLKDPVWFWQRNTSGMCRWYLCNPASRRCMTVTIHWVR